PAIVILVVLPTVITGGMRSVTVAQAVQYWFKLSALLIPTIFIVLRLGVGDADFIPDLGNAFDVDLVNDSESSTYRTISLVAALILGTLGLSRSEEHTSELQSRFDLVCRLLLEKKNKK